MKRCKLKITIVATYDAEFEDVAAASEMIEMLERDPHPGTPLGLTTPLSITAESWRIRIAKKNHSVEVVNDDQVLP
jgi:hypothetical protein